MTHREARAKKLERLQMPPGRYRVPSADLKALRRRIVAQIMAIPRLNRDMRAVVETVIQIVRETP